MGTILKDVLLTNAMKFLWLSLFCLTLTSACSSGGNLAEQHMKLLADGKAGEAQSQYCALNDNLRLVTVNSYELKSETEIDGGTEYVYSVDSPDVDGEVVIQVIKSDDLFNLSVASTAQLNDALEQSAELLGEEAEILPVPRREEYNQNETCVFLPFEQFDDE